LGPSYLSLLQGLKFLWKSSSSGSTHSGSCQLADDARWTRTRTSRTSGFRTLRRRRSTTGVRREVVRWRSWRTRSRPTTRSWWSRRSWRSSNL